MTDETATPGLNTVLVTGGNGFIAYHLISKLVEEEPECTIHCIDIDTTRNRHENKNVHYHHGDLSSPADVMRITELVQPVIIFHTASSELFNISPAAHYNIIVKGTEHLLYAATKIDSVRALVYTSTSAVIHDNVTDLVDASEDLPVLRPPKQKRICSLVKAYAEEAIISANRTGDGDNPNKCLLTCSLRPCLVFGECDINSLGKMVTVALQGHSYFQIGDGDNLYDFVYAGNLADAHILAARKLLAVWGKPPSSDPNTRVDGEIFNITNDDPWLFGDFQREVSAQTGRPVRAEQIVVIPKWVGLAIGFVSEWLWWAISGGTSTPNITRESIRSRTTIRTLNSEKAKRALGYRPSVSMKEGIALGVRWFLEERDKKGV